MRLWEAICVSLSSFFLMGRRTVDDTNHWETIVSLDLAEIERRIADSYELPNNVLDAVPEPVVTVRTSTYQHAEYIRDCIEGVLMQETSFPFEYIIGEDFSTDGTREIVIAYAEQYPDIIRVVTADYNVGSKANAGRCSRRARGKYMALCEGDDYWTDPQKLQKQVDFLDAHPRYGVVHGDYDLVYTAKKKALRAANKEANTRTTYTDKTELFDLLVKGSYRVLTATVLFRKAVCDAVQPELDAIGHKFLMGDTPRWLEMSRLCDFHYMDEAVAVYRVLPESASHSRDRARQLRFYLSVAEMRVYFVKKYRSRIPSHVRHRYNRNLLLYKAAMPEYVAMYPLIEPTFAETFFYDRIEWPLVGFLVRQWFRFRGLRGRLVSSLQRLCRLPWQCNIV